MSNKWPAVVLLFVLFNLNCRENVEQRETPHEEQAEKIQAMEEDRIPAEEAKLIEALKKAIRSTDKAQVESLYYLENANPQYTEMVPYVIDQLMELGAKSAEFSIVADRKAAEFNMKFTTLYVGQLVVIKKGDRGTEKMKVPVGIKDGRYYLTVGAH